MSRDDRARLPWLTLLLIVALLAVTPYAMGFAPADPLRAQRVLLVVFGLLATAVASVECLVMVRRRPALPSILGCVTAWFACAVLGWRSLPYWVTGAYAVYSGRAPRVDLDPKGLIPMTWLGELWRLGVLALYAVSPLIVVAAVLGSVSLVRRRAELQSGMSLACAAVGLAFLLGFSPGYLTWLMD